MEILEKLSNLVKKINESNSTLRKIEILEKYGDDEIKKLLYYIYNPFFNFHITSDNIKKNLPEKEIISSINFDEESENIFDLLDYLNSQKACSNEIIDRVIKFVQKNIEYKDIIYKILDRNLKSGISIKSINSLFPNLIPQFSVALANKYSEDLVDFEKEEWVAERKMDGVRVIIIKDGEKVDIYSRNGKLIETLDKIKDEIFEFTKDYEKVMVDGEICKVFKRDDGKENESFQGIMKEIRRKNWTIQNPRLYVFDILTFDEFFYEKQINRYFQRLEILENLFSKKQYKYLKLIQYKKIYSTKDIEDGMDEAIKNNWEGLILRKNSYYLGRRTNDLLKVKKFHDAEYKVVDVEIGKMKILNEKTGKMEDRDIMKSAIIIHKGNKVNVGSGWSGEQRERYYAHPEEIIGKIITVKYFEETKNQDGNYSLRFPVVKAIHGEKREF